MVGKFTSPFDKIVKKYSRSESSESMLGIIVTHEKCDDLTTPWAQNASRAIRSRTPARVNAVTDICFGSRGALHRCQTSKNDTGAVRSYTRGLTAESDPNRPVQVPDDDHFENIFSKKFFMFVYKKIFFQFFKFFYNFFFFFNFLAKIFFLPFSMF